MADDERSQRPSRLHPAAADHLTGIERLFDRHVVHGDSRQIRIRRRHRERAGAANPEDDQRLGERDS